MSKPKYIDADRLIRRLENRTYRAKGKFIEMVNEQSAADVEPRWIPVTERLPEEEGQYLVCCNGKYTIEVARFYIDEDGERYFGCDWNDPEDIVAWMSLPTPYKGGAEE